MRFAEGVRVADGVIVGLIDVEGRVNAAAGMIFAETALKATEVLIMQLAVVRPGKVSDGMSAQFSFMKISALNKEVDEAEVTKRAYILEFEEYIGLVPRATERVRLKPAADAGDSSVQAVAPSKTEWLKKKPMSFTEQVPAEYSTPVWYSAAPPGRSHSSVVLKILANTGAPKMPKPGMTAHAPAARLKATGAREAEHAGGALTVTLLSDGQNWKLAPEASPQAGPTWSAPAP
jgi:hypothetical protein